MGDRRTLRFHSEDDVFVELTRLRHGYDKTGNWTLEQIAWHLVQPIEKYTSPPTDPDAKRSPAQDAMKAGFVDAMLKTRAMPAGVRDLPPDQLPPASANDADVQRLVSAFKTLRSYPHPLILMGPIGPVATDEVRQCHLVHAEHHLSFLQPHVPARRDDLTYANEDECLADVAMLRKGHTRCGDWTLNQICWHLAITTESRMKPGPHQANSPEQDARKPALEKTLRESKLPVGIVAPEAVYPPADAGDEAIDRFVDALTLYKSFPGPTAPHRIFGQLNETDSHQLNLIHCANHLRYLTPI